MRHVKWFLLVSLFFISSCTVDVGRLMNVDTGADGGLSERDVVGGLVEALRIGTQRAADKGGGLNGFYGNPSIKIGLPPSVRKIKSALEFAGMGSVIRDFEKSMNRAAERSVPEAVDIFWTALTEMTFSDAWGILRGGDNAATEYFRAKTYGALKQLFRPMVHDSMAAVGVTSYYQQIEHKINSLPVQLMDTDLDNYVTEKALDGLFKLLADEEKKIRHDPVARTTDILRKVFG